MGGREFAILAGEGPDAPVDGGDDRRAGRGRDHGAAVLRRAGRRLSGQRRCKGRIVGPEPGDARGAPRAGAPLRLAPHRRSASSALGAKGTIVLDGSFTRDPLYAGAGRTRFHRPTVPFFTTPTPMAPPRARRCSPTTSAGPAPAPVKVDAGAAGRHPRPCRLSRPLAPAAPKPFPPPDLHSRHREPSHERTIQPRPAQGDGRHLPAA